MVYLRLIIGTATHNLRLSVVISDLICPLPYIAHQIEQPYPIAFEHSSYVTPFTLRGEVCVLYKSKKTNHSRSERHRDVHRYHRDPSYRVPCQALGHTRDPMPYPTGRGATSCLSRNYMRYSERKRSNTLASGLHKEYLCVPPCAAYCHSQSCGRRFPAQLQYLQANDIRA